MDLLKLLSEKVLISDGAIGTSLQARGLSKGTPPEAWNLENPEKVEELHEDYVTAGANILTTNTFGGNRIKLASQNLENYFREINITAVELAEKARQKDVFIAGSIGPTGLMMKPFGELSFDGAHRVFSEQAELLAEAGVDIITIETMTEIREFKAATIAAKETTSLPIISQMSFDDDGRTVTGTPPEVTGVVANSLATDICGVNCGKGLQENLQAARQLSNHFKGFLIAQPNAGLPYINASDETVYPASPEELADFAEEVYNLGFNIIGSCCGSTPEHTAQICSKVKGLSPKSGDSKRITTLTSRTRTCSIKNTDPVTVIGERINPSGRENLKKELSQNKFSHLKELASIQVEKGTKIIDLNVGIGSSDEDKLMKRAVKILDNTVQVPFLIDSDSKEVIEAGLKSYPGKTFINSVNGKPASFRNLLPLAKKYGAGVIILTLDDNGIPDAPQKRLDIAQDIAGKAKNIGIKAEDIVIDPIVLPVSSDIEAAKISLQTLRLIKSNTDFITCMGASNISYGLPGRYYLNASFISMAIEAGLDSVIANPSEEMVRQVHAASVLAQRDQEASKYIKLFQEEGANKSEIDLSKKTPYQMIINGDIDGVKEVIEERLNQGAEARNIVDDKLIPAMKEVGRKFKNDEYFLPQVLASADTMKKALSVLKPQLLNAQKTTEKGTVILATVEGDIHDIGKNLVKIMLEVNGYQVKDLGKSVPSEEIIRACKDESPDLLGLSALMTTTRVKMEEVVKGLERENISVKTIIGGACVNLDYAQQIGADSYAGNAVNAVKVADNLIAEEN